MWDGELDPPVDCQRQHPLGRLRGKELDYCIAPVFLVLVRMTPLGSGADTPNLDEKRAVVYAR
jgi:hypothetical protein